MTLLLVVLFILLLAMGLPIAYAIGSIAVLGIMSLGTVPLITVVQKMFSGLNSFTLLAVPLFILAANIMNKGKISDRLIDFARSLVGHIPGGLAHTNVLVSMLFAGISGSSQADTAGIGKILIPKMIEEGYDKGTSVGVTAASSTIGVIIPPSIPMVVYASVATASVGALFLGGIIPGILIGFGQMCVVYVLAKKHHFPKYPRMTIGQILKEFIINLPALTTPIIIIGGVTLGIFTPTEAACIACMYAAFLGFVVFRTLKLKDMFELLVDTLKLTSVSLFALATANALGQLLSYYNVSKLISEMFTAHIPTRAIFLVVVILFFLCLGTFMDAIPAMILFVPVLLPIAQTFGVPNVHLGLIIVITLAIGQVTPPYGLCLLLAGRIGKLSVDQSFKAVIPYIIIELVVVILLAFLPDVAFAIPRMIQPDWF